MNLLVIIPASDNEELTKRCAKQAEIHATDDETEIVVFDNGVGFGEMGPGYNIGVYPVFFYVIEHMCKDADILLFIHSDLIIHEYGYDARLIEAFEKDREIGLVGFVGSNIIDSDGGRGLGTRSNFAGTEPNTGDALVHGAQDAGLTEVAHVDGCAMAFRTTTLREIPFQRNFPVHHFYDRLMSVEVLWRGWRVGNLGISCDHLGGQTACKSENYHRMSREWLKRQGIALIDDNPDLTNYRVAESMFLREWRDERGFIPLEVDTAGGITHRQEAVRGAGKIWQRFKDGTADSDIYEHMDTLHDLVLKTNAQDVLELGTKLANSTLAFLAALDVTGGILHSIDIDPCLEGRARVEKYFPEPRSWRFIQENILDYDWRFPIDVLLIDSEHSYEHTLKELWKYSGFVIPRGYVILHDTKSFLGVWQAIQGFLQDPECQFRLAFHHENNHGLAALRRMGD